MGTLGFTSANLRDFATVTYRRIVRVHLMSSEPGRVREKNALSSIRDAAIAAADGRENRMLPDVLPALPPQTVRPTGVFLVLTVRTFPVVRMPFEPLGMGEETGDVMEQWDARRPGRAGRSVIGAPWPIEREGLLNSDHGWVGVEREFEERFGCPSRRPLTTSGASWRPRSLANR